VWIGAVTDRVDCVLVAVDDVSVAVPIKQYGIPVQCLGRNLIGFVENCDEFACCDRDSGVESAYEATIAAECESNARISVGTPCENRRDLRQRRFVNETELPMLEHLPYDRIYAPFQKVIIQGSYEDDQGERWLILEALSLSLENIDGPIGNCLVLELDTIISRYRSALEAYLLTRSVFQSAPA